MPRATGARPGGGGCGRPLPRLRAGGRPARPLSPRRPLSDAEHPGRLGHRLYYEAAACGLRVVGGVGGGSADAVPDGRVGVLVDPSDQAALVTAIAGQLGARQGRSGGRRALPANPLRRGSTQTAGSPCGPRASYERRRMRTAGTAISCPDDPKSCRSRGSRNLDKNMSGATASSSSFLAWRDVSVRYKQTMLGVAWAFMRPFLTMVVFTVVFGQLAKLPPGGDVPYAVMVFAGLLPWTLFSSILARRLVERDEQRQPDQQGLLPAPAGAVGDRHGTRLIDFAISLTILVGLMIWYAVECPAGRSCCCPSSWRSPCAASHRPGPVGVGAGREVPRFPLRGFPW